MTATVNSRSPWQDTGEVDPALVGRIHRVVGDALTEAHSTQDDLGRPRLAAEDERALARKLVADELLVVLARGPGDELPGVLLLRARRLDAPRPGIEPAGALRLHDGCGGVTDLAADR